MSDPCPMSRVAAHAPPMFCLELARLSLTTHQIPEDARRVQLLQASPAFHRMLSTDAALLQTLFKKKNLNISQTR